MTAVRAAGNSIQRNRMAIKNNTLRNVADAPNFIGDAFPDELKYLGHKLQVEANDELIICSDDAIRYMLDEVECRHSVDGARRPFGNRRGRLLVSAAAGAIFRSRPGRGTHEKWIQVRDVYGKCTLPNPLCVHALQVTSR
jgi:hypothetical protein